MQTVQTPFITNEQIETIIRPHIVIKAQKEDIAIEESAEDRGNTFELEEV